MSFRDLISAGGVQWSGCFHGDFSRWLDRHGRISRWTRLLIVRYGIHRRVLSLGEILFAERAWTVSARNRLESVLDSLGECSGHV